ncbi:MAG: YdeI/OmpD-associated family protein [Phycisphaerae bacterium]
MEREHERCPGVWVRFFKKVSAKETVRYAEALDVALCFGWIDGQVKPLDAESYLQKFTPRRARSTWSKRNVTHVERLIRDGLMRPAGLAAVEAAKKDGRWEAAYDSPRNMQVPADFLARLRKEKKAYAFFESLTRANVYAIAYRLQTAKKAETRERRMVAILEMMRRGEKFH